MGERDVSKGEVPVVWSEAGGGIGVAGEGVEGSDSFCGIHCICRRRRAAFLSSMYVVICFLFVCA